MNSKAFLLGNKVTYLGWFKNVLRTVNQTITFKLQRESYSLNMAPTERSNSAGKGFRLPRQEGTGLSESRLSTSTLSVVGKLPPATRRAFPEKVRK